MDQTKPVSPYSIRGIARGIGNAYDSAVGATSNAIEAVARPFSTPPGYTPAVAQAPATPAPAPMQPPPTVSGAIGAIRAHQQELANLADGGMVGRDGEKKRRGFGARRAMPLRGSDAPRLPGQPAPAPVQGMADGGKIGPVDHGGFHRWLGKPQDQPITAADIARGLASKDPHVRKMANFARNAQQWDHSGGQMMAHGGQVHGPGTGTSDSIPVNLSKGEYVMPADSTRRIGVRKLDAMRKATHKFVDTDKDAERGRDTDSDGMKNGGRVADRDRDRDSRRDTDRDGMANGGMACGPKLGARRKGMADGGAVEVSKDPTTGTTSFSGGNVSGAPSYTGNSGFTPSGTGGPTGGANVIPSAIGSSTTSGAATAPTDPAGTTSSPALGASSTTPSSTSTSPATGSTAPALSEYEKDLNQRNLETTASSIVQSKERDAARGQLQQQASPAATATSTAPPAAAPASPAGAGGSQYEQELAQRNLQTTASSIVPSQERDAARASLNPGAAPAQRHQYSPPTIAPGGYQEGPPMKRITIDGAPIPGMKHGGLIRAGAVRRKGYANGGMVDDLMPRTRAVLTGSGEDANAAVNRGDFAGAAGNVVRGATALPIAVANDVVSPALQKAIDVGGRFLSGVAGPSGPSASPAATPTSAGSPAPLTANRTATPSSRPASSRTQVPGTPAAEGAMGSGSAAPGPATPAGDGAIFRSTQPNGTMLYGDTPSAGATPVRLGAMRTGEISPQNMQAADNLSQKYATPRLGATRGADPANLPAGYGATIPADTGGYGILDANYQRERALRMDAASAAEQAARLGRAGRPMAQAAADAVRSFTQEQAGMPRVGMQETGATQRELARLASSDQQAAQRNALDARRVAATEAEAGARIGVSNQQLSAAQQIARLQAKFATTADPKEREQLRQQILLAQGRAQDTPNRYTVVPGGQSVDPTTNAVVREPSQVLDNQTGRFVQAAPATPRQSQSAFEAGKVYQDAQGRKAKWDGSKFVPV